MITREPRAAAEQPPHPFRTPAWYDPRLVHQPCMCPRCRPKDHRPEPRLRPFLIVVVLVVGVLWPIAALLVNLAIPVVALGGAGTAALLVAIASVVLNLVLCPARRDRLTREVAVSGPRSTALRVVLLLGALWSCLCWGYLGLLFLPLLPLSVLGVLFMGIGLCGLTPFVALPIGIVQARRAARVVGERLGRRAALLLVLAGSLLPPLAAAAAGIVVWRRRVAVEEQLAVVARQAPHSEARMQAIAALAGRSHALPALYLQLQDAPRQLAAAEAYLLLTDERLNEAVQQAAGDRHQRGAPCFDACQMIRPLWFLDGDHPLDGRPPTYFLRGL